MSTPRLLTADALRDAARESVKITPDPQSGEREGDPLRQLIPGDHTAPADVLALVQGIAGRRIIPGPFAGAAARSALRRWASLNPETEVKP